MTLPNIEVIFTRTNTPGNPQEVTAIPLVIDNACAGDLNTIKRINQFSDLTQFQAGPLPELCASILQFAGGPVYACRALTSTPSVIGAVTKTPGNAFGPAVPSFGSIIALGADNNGDVLIEAKQLGVSIVIIDPGMVNASTTVSVMGSAITVTLKHDAMAITETGMGLAAAITGNVGAAALVSATALGTGASLAGAHALATLNDGALNITPLTQGISYRVLLSGTSTPFSTSYSAGVITVNLATDTNGEPTTTAATAFASLTALAASNPGVFSVAEVGTGSLLLGAKPLTALQFGSTGSLITSGTACDKYDVIVKIVQGGTVGGMTPIIAIWSLDGGFSFSSRSIGVVSPTGVLILADSTLPSGITVTLSNAFDVGDTFTFSTSAPLTSSTDWLTALDACLADTVFQGQWGYATSATSMNKAFATLADGRLQTAFQNRELYGIFNTRDIGEGVPGETEAQWMAALTTDFAGFVSARGLTWISAGWLQWESPLTGRSFRRPNTFFVDARESSMPMHMDLGYTDDNTSSLNNVLAIYHNEFLSPGLDEQRFITTRTYTEQPGRFFITEGITMGDTNDLGSDIPEWVRIKLAVMRAVKPYLFRYINDTLQVIPIAESLSIPAGALAQQEADKIAAGVSRVVRTVLNTPKTDGKASASDFTVDVPRNYNLLQTQTLLVDITITPFGRVKQIIVNLALNLG